MHGWIGRMDRQGAEVDAVIHRADGSEAAGRLTNFSAEGCRIEAADDFRIGERLEIAIPGLGQFKAQVRWALLGSAGARFLAEGEA